MDYDDLRTEVKEAQEVSLEELQAAKAPTAMSAIREVEESDDADPEASTGEEITDELVIQVIPPRKDEFVCSSCFLVHHQSQLTRERAGLLYCSDCES
ncbi:DUF4193 domain-containing protein [Arthrobacter flavus]